MKKILLLALIMQMAATANALAQKQITTERIEVTNSYDAQPDREAMRIMERYKPAVDSVMSPILGQSLVGMTAARPESLLSNWAADVMVNFSDFDGGKRADMGLVNIGGLRNNMPEGTIRRGNILLISPFDNKLCVVELKGSDLMDLFRDIAAVHGEGVSREVRLVITQDGKLVDAKLNGKPIDPERTYRIATLDYLAEGNDHLYSLTKATRQNVSKLFTRDCMMKYIKKHSPITSKIEGRITVK